MARSGAGTDWTLAVIRPPTRTLASDLRGRAEDEAHDFQSSLDRASEHLRVDLGLRAVRAQGSTEALTHLSSEIRKRKAELTK